MIKKFISLLLIVAFSLFILSGCGGIQEEGNNQIIEPQQEKQVDPFNE